MTSVVQHSCWISALRRRAASIALALAVMLLAAVVATPSAQAQTFTLLYSFTGGTDGGNPSGGLVLDAVGNLYGTTSGGGVIGGTCKILLGCGTVFKLDTSGKETVLYSFTGQADGTSPSAGLILDAAGNLYGTTPGGGASGSGTMFKLDKAGTFTVLHSHGSSGGLVMDAAGNLYGSTTEGIFKLDPAGTFRVLDPSAGSGATLALDAAGNLYGTRFGGNTGGACGNNGCGIVFKLDTAGTYHVLYSFSGVGNDGYHPAAGLVLDAAGNLYGTTTEGGAPNCPHSLRPPVGCGTVFELSPAGVERVFSLRFAADPVAGLVFDTVGNLYGTTKFAGVAGSPGTVFMMDANRVETVLHFFAGLPDGQYPLAGVVLDPSGNLYGTTSTGGPLGLGTVFQDQPNWPSEFSSGCGDFWDWHGDWQRR